MSTVFESLLLMKMSLHIAHSDNWGGSQLVVVHISLFHCVAGVTECHLQWNAHWSLGSAHWKHPPPWSTTGSDGNRAEKFHPRIMVLTGQMPFIPISQGILRRQGSLSSKSHLKKPTGTLVRTSWELNTYLHQGYFTYWRRNDGPDARGLVSGKHTVLIHDHTSFHNSWQAAGTGAHFTGTEHSLWGSAWLL